MKRSAFLAILTAGLILCAIVQSHDVSARKISYKLKGDKKESTDSMAKGSFMVASQCLDCNNGYRIDQISFSGFDKPATSSTESFFITNHTDRVMKGVALYIEYLTPDGRQLHKRWLKLDCLIPPGETRKADIRSWDSQRSFHYLKSRVSKKSAPFDVVFDPVSFWLSF